MIARFFIDRPVLANVLAILMVVIGAVAILALPVTQYPPIAPPTVQVTASYPGANASTVQETVALPIEQQVNGAKDLLYLQSTSTDDGRYTLVATFKPGVDVDLAQVEIQNRVAIAQPRLPDAVQQQGVVTRQKSTAMLQMIALSSPDGRYDSLELANYASARLRDRLARLPGVGDVGVFGAGAYSMRVWLDPDRMTARGLAPADVIGAISRESQRISAGQIGMPPTASGQPLQLTINVDSRFQRPEDVSSIVIRAGDGAGSPLIRVGDVARVELGAISYGQTFKYDGKPAAGIAIFETPGANSLETAEAVRTTMEEVSEAFPEGLTYALPLDTSLFVDASIHEVYKTLIEAGILVLLVILLFLQDWRATLVPATTVPVTIIGAFAAMAAMGFSINLLTLFAIVLSIGIVVDDAIVVVEGVTQELEKGAKPRQAAARAMQRLTGPILGITLVLMAVFLPASFLPGATGAMYRQFALVIAATAFLSAVNALTLKPVQSAQLLRVRHEPTDRPQKGFGGRFKRGFERVYGRVENAYLNLTRRIVRRSLLSGLIALGLFGLAILGLTRIPTAFIPIEDQGYMVAVAQLPPGASLERTDKALNAMSRVAREVPGVDHAIAISGISALENNASQSSSGVLYIVLKDWKERAKIDGADLKSLNETLTERFRQMGEANVLLTVPPSVPGLGLSGGFQMQLQLTDGSNDYQRLSQVARDIATKAEARPEIARAFTPFQANTPQLSVKIDRARAQTLNVSTGDIADTLSAYMGSAYANQFSRFGQTYTIFVQADQRFRGSPDDLDRLSVRSRSGEMVPFSAFATVERTTAPGLIGQYNLYPTASLTGQAAPGYSSGQALAALEEIAEETLPPGMEHAWTGLSYQEKLAGNAALLAFGLAILLVYLVLAGQYESWWLPLAVIGSVPLALLGTVAVLGAVGLPNNIYVQIGLVLLIALSAKNAILIVEVARERRIEGESLEHAVMEACRSRFRPIIMTSLAFILGVVPLILSSGAGASARKSIGIAVASGMLTSTLLALLFVPAFYMVLAKLDEGRSRASRDVGGPRPTSA